MLKSGARTFGTPDISRDRDCITFGAVKRRLSDKGVYIERLACFVIHKKRMSLTGDGCLQGFSNGETDREVIGTCERVL